tara:strand:+ start:743 stop:931 length:189 start_codon:yes stop_codon:yes gene_type:complete
LKQTSFKERKTERGKQESWESKKAGKARKLRKQESWESEPLKNKRALMFVVYQNTQFQESNL